MSDSAIEDHVYDFIKAAIEEAEESAEPPEEGHSWVFDPDNPLAGAELHDHIYREIKTEYGIRIGDGDSEFVPNPGDTEDLEADGFVPIVVFSAVSGADRSDRKAARTRMVILAKKVSRLFREDPTMGSRVNDSRVRRVPRSWDSIKSTPYSVANMALIVNETGGPVE